MKKTLCAFLTILLFSHLHCSSINWTSPPTVLSGLNINTSDPQIAIDGGGNVAAAWIENNVVKSRQKLVNDNAWSATVNVSSSGATALNLVMDSLGNATLAWLENGVVKTSSKALNGTWSIPKALSTTNASSPTLAVDGAGNLIAAWVKGGNVETSTKIFGATWQGRVSINSPSTASSPYLAIGGSGSNARAVIVWQGTSGDSKMILSSTKLVSGAWSTGQVISETNHYATGPSVAVDKSGNALAIWYSYDVSGNSYSNVVVKSAGRPSNSSWGTVSDLSLPGLRNPSTLMSRIEFDSIGNAISLWTISFDDETYNIQSAIKPVNGNWSEAVDLVNSNLYACATDLSVTSFGDVLSLYLFYNGSSLMIQSIESDINGFLNNFWSVPITLSLGSANAYPKIAATLSGNSLYAAAVWKHFDGAFNSIVASIGSKTLLLPPSGLIVSQGVNNFGVFSEYYNVLSWQPSPDPNVSGYLVFRNGTFIAEVSANVLQYIDNNRPLNGPVSYSVAAIDNQNAQSAAISINFP